MSSTFERPFPALTSAQRYHLDVNGYDLNGYVVVQDVLSRDAYGILCDGLQRVKRDIRTLGSTFTSSSQR
jgi:hypothetical protein